MKKLLFLLFFVTTFSSYSQLRVNLNNIDDTGFAAVIHPRALDKITTPDRVPIHFRVDWNNGNKSGSQDLYNKIPSDGGVLVVGLWNKVYSGLFGGGKYSYSISTYFNGNQIISESRTVRDNSEGMKFFKAYFVSKDGEYVDLEMENYDAFDALWRMYSAKLSGEGGVEINWAPIIEGLSKY